MVKNLKEIIEDQRAIIKSIGKPLFEAYSKIKEDYSSVVSQFPELKNNIVESLIEKMDSMNDEISESVVNLLSDINSYVSLILGLNKEYQILIEETKILSSDKGMFRIIISDSKYLKPRKEGESLALDVQLSSEDEFRTKVEPRLANMIVKSSLFNALGDYLESNYGSRDLDVVLESNRDKSLPTVRYENGQVVKYKKTIEDSESKKAFMQALALDQNKLMMKTYSSNRAMLEKEYPSIKDSLGLSFVMAMEPLLSELTDLEIKLSHNNLKADERKELIDKVNSIKADIGSRVSLELKKYPKLAELMKSK